MRRKKIPRGVHLNHSEIGIREEAPVNQEFVAHAICRKDFINQHEAYFQNQSIMLSFSTNVIFGHQFYMYSVNAHVEERKLTYMRSVKVIKRNIASDI